MHMDCDPIARTQGKARTAKWVFRPTPPHLSVCQWQAEPCVPVSVSLMPFPQRCWLPTFLVFPCLHPQGLHLLCNGFLGWFSATTPKSFPSLVALRHRKIGVHFHLSTRGKKWTNFMHLDKFFQLSSAMSCLTVCVGATTAYLNAVLPVI